MKPEKICEGLHSFWINILVSLAFGAVSGIIARVPFAVAAWYAVGIGVLVAAIALTLLIAFVPRKPEPPPTGTPTGHPSKLIAAEKLSAGTIIQVDQVVIRAPTEPRPSEPSHPQRPAGALPSIWNVPHNRNPNFTGRDTLLTDLRTALTSGQPAALTQAISGLGGAGKTQLAVEYAYRHAAEYELVWWIRAEEPATLAGDYAALAEPLNLPVKGLEQPLVTAAVRRWLGQNPGWLLVFDSARDPDGIRDYLPQGSGGHILVTSRNPNWGAAASPLPVGVWERRDSIQFLLRRTGQSDEDVANDLADTLGDLPLALEQAAAYMVEIGKTLKSYLDLFKAHESELLKRGAPSRDYPWTVASTWEISFHGVQEAWPAAAALLNLCAFLAPDSIPLEIVTSGTQFLPKDLAATAADPLQLDQAVATLRRFSLVEVAAHGLSVHRLVQAVVRDRLAAEERTLWAGAALSLIDKAFPHYSDDVRTWDQCSRMLPHALAVSGHCEALGLARGDTSHLLNQVGEYLHGRARFTESKEALQRALSMAEAAFGPNHPSVAACISNLGSVFVDLGDPLQACKFFQRALVINEAALGSNHPDVATCLNNLGGALLQLGDPLEACEFFERALAINKAVLGSEHPSVAVCLNNLGGALHDQGDLAGARALFERALDIDEAAFGPNHPSVARDINNLGGVLRGLNDLPGARECFKRALAIDEAALTPNHPEVAVVVNNLGGILKRLGDLPGARDLYERAFDIEEAVFGPDHPRVAAAVYNLGAVLRALGDLPRARKYYGRALAIFRKALGETHPHTVQVRNNLESLGE